MLRYLADGQGSSISIVGAQKYRLVDEAVKYGFIHKPFEDKTTRQKHERDDLKRQKNGLRDDPKFSENRFINKIFDHKRAKAKKLM